MGDSTPNVFLSWSGEFSKSMAGLLREWLPNVVRDAVPWMSSEDIAKGTVWSNEINAKLADCRVGIICLTRTNLTAPWVLFEAGALFKAMRDRYVCTLLCDFDPPVTGPLGQFQATVPTEVDMLRLCRDTDAALRGSGAASIRLESWFEKFWPDLRDNLVDARSASRSSASVPVEPSDRQLLEEVLATVRTMQRQKGAESDELAFEVGEWVDSPRFGRGRVVAVATSGRILTVAFGD